jgi:threonine dehydratase
VIAASAGNHALALSYHGQQLGIPVTVVMPTNAPINKIASCRKHGANVHVQGSDLIDVSSLIAIIVELGNNR